MGTSETPGQLTIRLEMGQGRTVHFFIALVRETAEAVKDVEESNSVPALADLWRCNPRLYLFLVVAGAALLVVAGQGGFDDGVGDGRG